jgi:hypothetical protein
MGARKELLDFLGERVFLPAATADRARYNAQDGRLLLRVQHSAFGTRSRYYEEYKTAIRSRRTFAAISPQRLAKACPDVLRKRQSDGIALAWIEFVECGIKRPLSKLDSKPCGRTRDPVNHPRGSPGMLQFTRDRVGDKYLGVQRQESRSVG